MSTYRGSTWTERWRKRENVHVRGLYVNEKGKKEGKCPRTGLYVNEKGKKEGKCPRMGALREQKGEERGKMSTYGALREQKGEERGKMSTYRGSTWTKRGRKRENVHVWGFYVNEKRKKEVKCPRMGVLRERKREERGKMSTYQGSTWTKRIRNRDNVHVSGLYVKKGKKEGKCRRIGALRERKAQERREMSTNQGSTWTKRGKRRENVHVWGFYVNEKGKKEGKCPRIRAQRGRKVEEEGKCPRIGAQRDPKREKREKKVTYNDSTWPKRKKLYQIINLISLVKKPSTISHNSIVFL
jgi:hypothetical protein